MEVFALFANIAAALGVFLNGTEIKPFEPDPGNTGEGKSMLILSFRCFLGTSQPFLLKVHNTMSVYCPGNYT
jgi:hypothetical protein